ncbi:hypothetical protein GCM10007173_24850 [Glutamicibacter ardleyensis]|uniref:Uncharacterized protein n=1 Tax=Glutamicibacter ardleyensis TaxID=225894 RepID=A0ABQ2DS02_9MICC|nr:hypothetical protein GCM10007173_24850 [Glutamicibacter ardleyensis]
MKTIIIRAGIAGLVAAGPIATQRVHRSAPRWRNALTGSAADVIRHLAEGA